MKKHILLAGTAFMCLASANAFAATAAWPTTPLAGVKVAVQHNATFLAGVLGTDEVATIPPITGATGLKVGDKLVITMAGAKFNRTNLAAAGQAVVTAAGVTFATGTWTLDATNTILTTTAVNGVTTAAGAAQPITIAASHANKIIDLTGVAKGTNVTFSVAVNRNSAGLLTNVHTAAASPSTVVIGDLLSASSTANTGTITVASGFKTLSGTTSATTSLASSYVTTIGDATPTGATGTGLVTISGDMSGVASITDKTTAVTACDATGAAKTVTAGSYWIDVATSKAYGCLTNTLVKAAATIDPIFTVDNTTAKATRAYSVALNYVAGTADVFASQAVPAIGVLKLSRDGSAFSVNAAGPLNTIKITDMSGTLSAATGKISVVAYDAAGAMAVGTAPVIPALTSNGTNVIAMSSLIAAYPTAVRFDFTVESTQIVASNVKKSATGTTVTVYRNAVSTGATTVGNGAI